MVSPLRKLGKSVTVGKKSNQVTPTNDWSVRGQLKRFSSDDENNRGIGFQMLAHYYRASGYAAAHAASSYPVTEFSESGLGVLHYELDLLVL